MKMLKLAVGIGLAGSTLAMLTSPAQAFTIGLSSPTPSPNPSSFNNGVNGYIFDYSLSLNPGDSIVPGEKVTIVTTGNKSIVGGNVSPQARSYFDYTPGNGNTATTWTANSSFSSLSGPISLNGFQLISTSNDTTGSTNYSITNGGTTIASGSVVVPAAGVPEAKSSLAAVMALGFGYLYQRKLQKKGNFKP